MATNTVRVVARITAQAEKIEALKPILLELVGPTRQEPGCLGYQLLQNTADPSDFTFIEEWASDAAIDRHLVTPHLQQAFSKALPLLVGEPDIRRYSITA